MNFTLRSYEGSISGSQENAICTIVDSIRLNYEVEAAPTVEASPAFQYTDKDTGVTFTVPDGWNKATLYEQRNYLDTKFESVADPGLIILYGSTDIWSELSPSERAGYSRADLSSDIFTKQDIADIFGTNQYLVDDITYGGVHYFKVVIITEKEALGLKLSITMTQLFRVENGWGYTFQFAGDESSPYYADFVSLIKSAKYPEVSNTSSAVLAVVLLAMLTITVIAVVIAKRRKAQKNIEVTPRTLVITSQSVVNEKETPFCHMCGTELPIASAFCHKCGAKQRKGE